LPAQFFPVIDITFSLSVSYRADYTVFTRAGIKKFLGVLLLPFCKKVAPKTLIFRRKVTKDDRVSTVSMNCSPMFRYNFSPRINVVKYYPNNICLRQRIFQTHIMFVVYFCALEVR